MAGKGAKPKPAELKRLEGLPGKRKIEMPTVIAEGPVFIPPHLHEDAQACVEMIKRSMPPRIYSALDSFGLAAFATAWAWHKAATHEMTNPEFEPVLTDRLTQVQRVNPWFRILNSQSAEMRSWGDRLGLNPAARATLKMPGHDAPKSKFAGLSGQTGLSTSLNS